jgi:hypothetical protein
MAALAASVEAPPFFIVPYTAAAIDDTFAACAADMPPSAALAATLATASAASDGRPAPTARSLASLAALCSTAELLLEPLLLEEEELELLLLLLEELLLLAEELLLLEGGWYTAALISSAFTALVSLHFIVTPHVEVLLSYSQSLPSVFESASHICWHAAAETAAEGSCSHADVHV